jgi:hypothetical protein
MPRKKPSDITQIKIRVREDLRRQLEAAAKKRDVSINFEMVDRLRASFDQGDRVELSRITADLSEIYERTAQDIEDRNRQSTLVNAAEYLIERLRKGEAVEGTIDEVEKAVKAITNVYGRTYLREPWEE